MSVLTITIIVIVAALHLYFMWFEMFRWTTRGPKIFRNFAEELFEPSKTLAANQGLYNGFLAAGLLWSVFITDPTWQRNVALCFLLFVAIAGIYGGFSAARKIFIVQGIPAIAGLISLFAS